MIDRTTEPLYDELESMYDTPAVSHEHFGDPLEEQSSPDITRLYIQNVNGLCWDSDGGRWPYICETMSTIGVDIACFSELNTNTNKLNIRRQMEKICQQHFEQSRLIMSTSNHKTWQKLFMFTYT